MQVILLEDIKKLGEKGQVIKVAEGYGRNFLIPKGLAVEASQGKLKDLEKQNQIQAAHRKQMEDEAKLLGEQLEGLKLVMKAKVGEAGKLFGAINNKDIAECLQKKHSFMVDKKKIILKAPIKALGEYSVTIKLHPLVQAQINVEVVSE